MRGPSEFLFFHILLLSNCACSSRTCSHIRGYAGIHLPRIKASSLKSCRKFQPFFYTLMQEKIAAVFLETLDNNRIEPRTKIRYNSITVQREIPLKLPAFCCLFHLLETLDSLRRALDYSLFLIGGDCLNQNIPRPASPLNRELRCPHCRHLILIASADARGHIQTKCKACKREILFDLDQNLARIL